MGPASVPGSACPFGRRQHAVRVDLALEAIQQSPTCQRRPCTGVGGVAHDSCPASCGIRERSAVMEPGLRSPLRRGGLAAAGFTEVNGPPAWKSLPSWAVVGTGDRAAGADIVRSMAQRAGARITELDGSHVIMVSRPRAVTHVILEALEAVR